MDLHASAYCPIFTFPYRDSLVHLLPNVLLATFLEKSPDEPRKERRNIRFFGVLPNSGPRSGCLKFRFHQTVNDRSRQTLPCFGLIVGLLEGIAQDDLTLQLVRLNVKGNFKTQIPEIIGQNFGMRFFENPMNAALLKHIHSLWFITATVKLV